MDSKQTLVAEPRMDDLHELFHLSYLEYAPNLTAHANYKLRDHANSEDLVQTTFLKTWLYLRRGGKIHLMRAFLYHVLNDLITDEYRKKKSVSLDQLIQDGYEPSLGDTAKLYDLFDGKQAIALISKLTPTYRNVIKMRYLDNLSLSEMATLTGQTKNAMAVQVHRGLTKMKLLYDANDIRHN